jgi:probable selenium-dependent hydroxylase accessory protein YqeC
MIGSGLSPVPLDEVAVALGLGRHEHVALVGGGGKTTLLHAMARQLTGRRIVTTTTKMGADQSRGLPVLVGVEPTALAPGAPAPAATMVWRAVEGSKALGVAPEVCDRWFGLVDHVLVEADGSRRLPFKAPATFEPVVPATATLVVSVMGADALGRVILDRCHRPLRVAALAGCPATVRLTPEAAARVLLHPRGFRRAVPPGALFAIAVTKVDAAVEAEVAALVAAVADQAAAAGLDVPIVAVAATGSP